MLHPSRPFQAFWEASSYEYVIDDPAGFLSSGTYPLCYHESSLASMFSLFSQLVRHLMPGVIRPMRVLWNEVIGFVFLSIAFIVAVNLWRTWRHFNGSADDVFKMVVSSIFGFMMTYFGISSFWRARKIGRQ